MRERLRIHLRALVPPAASIPPAIGVVVFITALWAQPGGLVGGFYDDGIYVALARALAEGHGYRNIHLPSAMVSVHYPPLYPALLAILFRLWPSFPENVVLFQMFDAAMLAGAAWVLASQVRRLPLSPVAAYAALLIGFTSFPLLTIVGVRFSEPLFLLLLAAASAAADRERPTLGWAAAAGALAGLSVLARTIGVAVIAAVCSTLWLRRERRGALVAFGVALAIATPWFLWTAAHAREVDPRIAANYGTYFAEAGQAGWRGVIAGLDFRALGPLVRLTIPILPLWLWYSLVALFLGIATWGAARLGKSVPALVAVVPLYTLIVTLWPYVPDRFMWVMLPCVALFLAAGIAAAWRWGPLGRGAVVVLGLIFTVGYARREFTSLTRRVFTQTAAQATVPIAYLSTAIAVGIPEDAVVATESEAAMYLYSGRRSVPDNLFRWEGRGTVDLPADSTLGFFCDEKVTHVAPFTTGKDIQPALAQMLARKDSVLTPLFLLGSGPGLFRFRCPR